MRINTNPPRDTCPKCGNYTPTAHYTVLPDDGGTLKTAYICPRCAHGWVRNYTIPVSARR